MSNKNKNQHKPIPTPPEPIEAPEDYVNEDGVVLMTEAQFREKFAAQPQPTTPMQGLGNNLTERAAQEAPHDFLEFTVSGSYYDSKKETIDFEGIKIRIPACDEERGIGSMHLRSRYVEKALRQELDKNGDVKYPKRIEKVRQVFVDDCKSAKGRLSFVGKNIKELTIEEMQDLATSKDLRFIPNPGSGMSKRDMQIRAYVAYSDRILKKTIKWQEESFNFAKLPGIILTEEARSEESGKISNEEMIDMERTAKATGYGEKDSPETRFTLEELKTIADSKSIHYAADVEFKELYSTLFSA